MSSRLSFVRFFSLVLIIICHFLQYYGIELAFWLNVGVQIFFILSGYLYGRKDVGGILEFYGKRVKKILVPYYSFLIIMVFVYIGGGYKEYINRQSVTNLFLCNGTIKGLGHLWFISYILFCYLLTPVLNDIRNRIIKYNFARKLIYCVLLMVLVHIICDKFIPYFNGYNVNCYIAGYSISILSQDKEDFKFARNTLLICSPLMLVMNGIQIYSNYINSGSAIAEIKFSIPYFDGYAHMLLGVCSFLFIYIICPFRKNNWLLTFSDQNSYYIYLVHNIFIQEPFTFMLKEQFSFTLMIISLVLIVFAGMLLKVWSGILMNLFQRFFWKSQADAIQYNGH